MPLWSSSKCQVIFTWMVFVISFGLFFLMYSHSRDTFVKPTADYSHCRMAIIGSFGVLGRSMQRSWPSVEKHILAPLKQAGFKVSVFAFDIDAGSSPVDGVRVNSSSAQMWLLKTVPDAVIISQQQNHVDIAVRSHCFKLNVSCSLRYDHEPLYKHLTANAFRQMYAESMVAKHILGTAKSTCPPALSIAFCSDNYFVQNISITDIETAIGDSRLIMLTDMNDGEGFTNGFYMGRPKTVATVLARFTDYQFYAYAQRDYEKTVQLAMQHHNITRVVTHMPFCKLRANGEVSSGHRFPKEKLSLCHAAAQSKLT